MLTSLGRLEIKKGHVLCQGTSKFVISERMRTLMCLIGQSVVFEEGSELLSQLLGVDVGSSQLQRVCTHVGNQVDPLIDSDCKAVIPRLSPSPCPEDMVYVMMDESMIFTRDNEWRELQLGRLFCGRQVVDIHAKRREVLNSVYVGHLGSVDGFFQNLSAIC